MHALFSCFVLFSSFFRPLFGLLRHYKNVCITNWWLLLIADIVMMATVITRIAMIVFALW